MNIIGPDALVFGVDDLAACSQYLADYGLKDVGAGRFEALDGTAVIVRPKDDASLPPAMAGCGGGGGGAEGEPARPRPPRWALPRGRRGRRRGRALSNPDPLRQRPGGDVGKF